MKCDCEEMNGQIVSVCEMHAALGQKYATVARRQTAPASQAQSQALPLNLDLRDKVLVAVIGRTSITVSTDPETFAQKVHALTDEIMRRTV
jgi:hypothetical protein